jgi:hypothetical protein
VLSFRKWDNFDNDLQKKLAQRLVELSGKPATSKLHIHPVSNGGWNLEGTNNQISVISSEQARKLYTERFANDKRQQSNKKDATATSLLSLSRVTTPSFV